jgi:hypothetical protein
MLATGFCFPLPAAAQGESGSRVGLASAAALELHGGVTSVERDAPGFEVGAAIDLGWLRTPRLRLQGEVDFMRAQVTQFVLTRDETFRGFIYDLSSTVSAMLLAGGAQQRLVPYLSAGVAVHALSSAFGAVELDRLYNTNPFGVHASLGLRLWLGASGRSGLVVEGRRVIADNVNRTSVRLGALAFFRDLIRPSR